MRMSHNEQEIANNYSDSLEKVAEKIKLKIQFHFLTLYMLQILSALKYQREINIPFQ